MAPRAYWKGYLKLSLVSCPVALYPATSDREKISFHQIHKQTGNRIRYKKVDADTGREVENDDIIKGYEVSKGEYVEVEPEELEAVEIESKRVIEIEQFVPKDEIDELYINNPYYIVPDGEVGQQAFAVIREAIRKEGMVALAKVVFTSREHIIAIEARGKGMMGVTLRYPYEVRKEEDYFDDIENERVPKDMLDLATHIVETKKGKFQPEKFEDRYEDALKEPDQEEAEGRKDRGAEGTRAFERRQSHGRATSERKGGPWERPAQAGADAPAHREEGRSGLTRGRVKPPRCSSFSPIDSAALGLSLSSAADHGRVAEGARGYLMKGKRVQFDDETWQALDLLGRDQMKDFQELADEAFRDLLRKHGRPADLKEALRRSAGVSATVHELKPAKPKKR